MIDSGDTQTGDLLAVKSGKRKPGRPAKYATQDERAAAKRLKVAAYRAKLREAGFRPVQTWVKDGDDER